MRENKPESTLEMFLKMNSTYLFVVGVKKSLMISLMKYDASCYSIGYTLQHAFRRRHTKWQRERERNHFTAMRQFEASGNMKHMIYPKGQEELVMSSFRERCICVSVHWTFFDCVKRSTELALTTTYQGMKTIF